MNRREWLAGAAASVTAAKVQAASNSSTSGLPGKADFPLAEGRTYLNNAGYHPMSVQAAGAVQDYLERRTEGTKEPDWHVSARVKEDSAAIVNARPGEIGYVTSTMAGENLVVAGLGLGRGGGNIVTDALHFEGSALPLRIAESAGCGRPRGPAAGVADDPRDLDRANRPGHEARGGLPTGSHPPRRVRVTETTLFCPWFFSGSGFEAFILVKNTTATARAARVTLSAASGATLGTAQTGVVPANGSYNLQVSSPSPLGFGLTSASGSVLIAHDAPPGSLIATVTSLSFSSGVSFDTPAAPRLDFR